MKFFAAVPWFLAGMAIAIFLATLLRVQAGRRLGVRPAHGWLLILGLGFVLSATLTPQREAVEFGATSLGTCDLTRMSLAPLAAFRSFNDTSINVALLMPLGAAIGVIPRSRAKAVVVVAAILLPLGIEAIQLLVPVLDRGCQSADVIDNLTGLALGAGLGSLAGRLAGGAMVTG